MSWNRSPLAFADVQDAFERALAHKRGIRIKCSTHSEAIQKRSRFNFYRILNRKQNAETYPNDHIMHGVSVYDQLILRIPRRGSEDDKYLYIEQRSVDDMQIEELP